MTTNKYLWEKYLNLEKDFIVAKRYVDFDASFFNTTSDFFVNEITLLGSLLETALKHLAKLKNPSCSVGNFGEIKGEILSSFPRIVSFETQMIGTNTAFKPFDGWDSGNLNWWSIYTDTKHGDDRHANMETALMMLSAFELVLFIIHAEDIKNGRCPSVNNDNSNVYYSLSEMPLLLRTKLSHGQMMGSGDYYFYFPVSQY